MALFNENKIVRECPDPGELLRQTLVWPVQVDCNIPLLPTVAAPRNGKYDTLKDRDDSVMKQRLWEPVVAKDDPNTRLVEMQHKTKKGINMKMLGLFERIAT
jgi:hypothetical protein